MTDLLLGHGLDPLPVPDEMEEQANHHDVTAVGVDVCDDALEGAAAAKAAEEMEVEHDARDEADEAADKQQQVKVKVLLHENPFYLIRYIHVLSLRDSAEKRMEIL